MIISTTQADYFRQETPSVNQRIVIRAAANGRFTIQKPPSDYSKSEVKMKIERYVKKRSS